MWPLIKRRFYKDKAIKDRAPGCQESIRWRLITYMWTFEYRLNKRLIYQIKELKARYPEVKFIEVRNDTELKKISKELSILPEEIKK